jgi:hypothetical protein
MGDSCRASQTTVAMLRVKRQAFPNATKAASHFAARHHERSYREAACIAPPALLLLTMKRPSCAVAGVFLLVCAAETQAAAGSLARLLPAVALARLAISVSLAAGVTNAQAKDEEGEPEYEHPDESCIVDESGAHVCAPGEAGDSDEDDDYYDDDESEVGTAPAPPPAAAGTDLGVEQKLDAGFASQILAEFTRQSRRYMEEVVHKDEAYAKVRTECRNNHELCSAWALVGEVSDQARRGCEKAERRLNYTRAQWN